jgi:hypothetical protein
MKVKTWFKRVNRSLRETNESEKTREELNELFELFRPYVEDDMIVAIKDLERT